MPALLAAIEQALAGVLNILGISQLMYGLLQQFGIVINTTAKEHFPFEVQGLGLAANNQLADPTFGLAAIKTELDGIGLAIIALGNPQQTAQPVTLPTTPPAGYGGASSGDVAVAVWQYNEDLTRYSAMGEIMAALNYLLVALNEAIALPIGTGAPFVGNGNLFVPNGYPYGAWPESSVENILPTDADIPAWLNRVDGYRFFVSQDPVTSMWTLQLTGSGSAAIWWCTLSDTQFIAIRDGYRAAVTVPPVWPGLANVTLGAPVAMTPPGDNVAVPCDGVIIAVTGTPSWAGSFSFGTAISYRNVGAVTFTDDNGEQEFAQTFSWTSGVYCPKSMRTAAGFAYRAAIGVSGTVTPFTIN